MSLWLSHPLPKLVQKHNNKRISRTGPEVYGQKGLFGVNPLVAQLPGWNDAMRFLPLVLDSKAGEGLAISVNRKAEGTTIYMNAGVALDLNSWDRRLDKFWLVSWLLFQ